LLKIKLILPIFGDFRESFLAESCSIHNKKECSLINKDFGYLVADISHHLYKTATKFNLKKIPLT
ncbi:unnamed protein product, partial [marine sediment metagenome]